jgi:hypothetical protein
MNTRHHNNNGNAWNSEAGASRSEECDVRESAAFKSNTGGGGSPGTPDVPFGTLRFRQWIKLALESADGGNSRAITSSDYLAAALNVAISLARQIDNQAEEQLPIMGCGCDWADCVNV